MQPDSDFLAAWLEVTHTELVKPQTLLAGVTTAQFLAVLPMMDSFVAATLEPSGHHRHGNQSLSISSS